MAYLKLKEYTNAIADADKAIELKPGYLKAYHRRGKAYQALEQYEDAIKDYQYILEEEEHNEAVNQDLKDARKALNEKGSKPAPKKSETKEKPKSSEPSQGEKKKFVRVAIEEDSDEEDEEPTIEEVGANKLVSKKIDSKFPLTTKKDIEAHEREAKKKMKEGGATFMKRFKARDEKPPSPNKEESKAKIQEVPMSAEAKNKTELSKVEENIARLKAQEQEMLKEVEEAKKKQQEMERSAKEAELEAKKAQEEMDSFRNPAKAGA
jgi:tetratricopeptide (TPR) repeat protein